MIWLTADRSIHAGIHWFLLPWPETVLGFREYLYVLNPRLPRRVGGRCLIFENGQSFEDHVIRSWEYHHRKPLVVVSTSDYLLGGRTGAGTVRPYLHAEWLWSSRNGTGSTFIINDGPHRRRRRGDRQMDFPDYCPGITGLGSIESEFWNRRE